MRGEYDTGPSLNPFERMAQIVPYFGAAGGPSTDIKPDPYGVG